MWAGQDKEWAGQTGFGRDKTRSGRDRQGVVGRGGVQGLCSTYTPPQQRVIFPASVIRLSPIVRDSMTTCTGILPLRRDGNPVSTVMEIPVLTSVPSPVSNQHNIPTNRYPSPYHCTIFITEPTRYPY
ncbi:hypothetical protein Pcinc_025729 [Petrolisthes cinctipes]|uniref:Uncharacterized protein n=1 Tax=Petrolisthes cinctipes TaxID=88211 RepID=A0AAE1F7X4_PETCI|nr:hypothetical protein Pcinc_025729 [Petrolisthes cinctipes]